MDFVETHLSQRGSLYRSVESRVVTERDVTVRSVTDALAWLVERTGPEDTGVVFLAGHGVNDPSGRYHFLPHDFDRSRPRDTAVPGSVFADALSRVRGRAFMYLDTCYAGSMSDALGDVSTDTSRFANTLSAPENSVTVFASSTGRQKSYERVDWGNGAFTKVLLEGLRGGAKLPASDVVTSRSLGPFVTDGVAKLTEGKQTPVAVIPETLPDRVLSALRAFLSDSRAQ
ncbi:MAG: caspase family protein [Gemmatimonadaceae bacterium]|jgi:uncharacterized caspase-like protein|nr:caspase family protein [Gemmatimonadaceae bacterium]